MSPLELRFSLAVYYFFSKVLKIFVKLIFLISSLSRYLNIDKSVDIRGFICSKICASDSY